MCAHNIFQEEPMISCSLQRAAYPSIGWGAKDSGLFEAWPLVRLKAILTVRAATFREKIGGRL